MDKKELLLEFGKAIFNGISYDKKKMLQNGQAIRLQSLDNGHYLEVHFQAISNSGNYATISPSVKIISKCTKSFQAQKFADANSDGLIFLKKLDI